MSLNNLVSELKVKVIIQLKNPTSLAKCSREWNNIVNSPSTKAKWLISRHGRTHALFYAVRMGEPFINIDVVECLFAQNAHLSRYFIQRLVLGFGKHDDRLIDLKLTHNMGTLDPDQKFSIKDKICSPWASNLSCDVYCRILEEGRDRFDGDNIPVCGNDMDLFYYLLGGPRQSIAVLWENIDKIKTLIRTYKFVPFPSRPRVRNSCLHTGDSDGYANDLDWSIIAWAIRFFPELIDAWQENGYPEIVKDVNNVVRAFKGLYLN